jgi:hypothetical protein
VSLVEDDVSQRDRKRDAQDHGALASYENLSGLLVRSIHGRSFLCR